MKNPTNHFKAALKEGRHQLGIWNTIGGNTVPEMLAGAGFDWMLIDCEHSAVETVEVQTALQAAAGFPSVSSVVRPAENDPMLIKRILDMGAQTLLIPYVETAEEAAAAVASMRYGPRGIRGMAGVTRATRYGQVENYFTEVEENLCLIVQIETVKGMENLEAIAQTDGVDAVFIGPADLSATMGLPGQTTHPDVVAQILSGFDRLAALGVPSGILTLDPKESRRFMDHGSSFTAVGVDLALLANSVAALRSSF